MGQFLPQWTALGWGRVPRGNMKWDPAPEPFPGVVIACGKVQKAAGAGWWPCRSLPAPISMILGIWSHTVFLCQRAAPFPGGVGRPAAGPLAGDAWAAEPGISLQTLTVSFLCGFLPVPTPHLCESPGILLSPAAVRAKALGEEIDRGLPPPRLLCWDLNDSLSLAS